jgi:D-alanyl-D-alanine carboxypeptidase/D-alanyl-D-alanine-endopeptidase (penicillin-binding protein 4)
MARQLFLTLAANEYPPPATTARAASAVRRWLAQRKLAFRAGAGQRLRASRRERISARSMARLLLAADASKVRSDYIAARVRHRRHRASASSTRRLPIRPSKTGTLEGVRAIAGYVLGPGGRRFVVVCFVNHLNAARAQPALDLLVERVYALAAAGTAR